MDKKQDAQCPAVPEGWKLVPVEPTREMVRAWETSRTPDVAGLSDDDANNAVCRSDWRAMLAAAPAATAQSGEPVAWMYSSSRGVDLGRMRWSDDMKALGPADMVERPLYAAPQPSPTAVVLDDERAAWDGDSRESRTAFRNYDTIAEPVSRKTPWQIWRDACAWQARAASPQPAVCATCNGHGMIGGPSYYAPDEGGEPCPDCTIAPSVEQTRAQTLTDDARDAARYRWLRSRDSSLETRQRDKGVVNGPSCYHEVGGIWELKWGNSLDEAIDAAMTAARPASGA